eukprot:4230732-Pyramimonas_sp.AAC.1
MCTSSEQPRGGWTWHGCVRHTWTRGRAVTAPRSPGFDAHQSQYGSSEKRNLGLAYVSTPTERRRATHVKRHWTSPWAL